MINRDKAVSASVAQVIELPRRRPGWYLTPEGEAALDALDAAEHERDIASQARRPAQQRRNQQIDGDPPASL